MTKNIAFIPAKTKSSRVPKKNYKVINNKRLIDYTIELAVKCDLIDLVVISSNEKVSTEITSDKIQYHLREGLEADPNISVMELLNLWKNKNSPEPNNLILLQPTHPFREMIHLKESISLFQRRLELDSLVSVTRKKIRHIKFDLETVNLDKQVSESIKFINGQIYIFRVTNENEIIFGKQTFLFEIPASEYDVNIDEPHDFRLAELLAKNFTPS